MHINQNIIAYVEASQHINVGVFKKTFMIIQGYETTLNLRSPVLRAQRGSLLKLMMYMMYQSSLNIPKKFHLKWLISKKHRDFCLNLQHDLAQAPDP